MPRLSRNTLKTSLAVLALALAVAMPGAEKEKPASFVGYTKEQLYARFGDPRSQMKAGVREVMIFPKLKVTLRNNVVVEAEELFDEPPPPKKSADAPAETKPASEAPAPASSATDAAAQIAATAAAAAAAKGVPPPAAEPKPASPPENNFEIKSVRSPGTPAPRPAPRPTAPVTENQAVATPVTRATSTPPPAPAPAPVQTPPATPVATTPVATTPAPTPTQAPATAPASTTPAPTTSAPAPTPLPATDEKPGASAETAEAAAAKDGVTKDATETTPKKAPKRFFRRRFDPENDMPEVSLFDTQTYVFGAALLGAVGYLIWRSRQRKLELEATTVSNTPFAEASAADTGAMFTPDLLAKLEWKRFEELVASYYVKTGVVAVRTKTGPQSPVHLKISWKGEAKPFACVQCHANPTGLIRVGPLQELFAALSTDDIRRGYVVTNGKFNVEARDFAEEKHFTLLPGDLLLEKLNALPPPARAELMQQITTGDYTTPTCPKCDVKMVKAEDGGWRCTKCEAAVPGMIG